MKYALIAVLLPLAGCAGFGMGGLSADQIAAAGKDKSSSAGCSYYTGTGGQFVAAFTNTDKGTLNTGGGSVKIKCGNIEFDFTDAGKAAVTGLPTVKPAEPVK